MVTFSQFDGDGKSKRKIKSFTPLFTSTTIRTVNCNVVQGRMARFNFANFALKKKKNEKSVVKMTRTYEPKTDTSNHPKLRK